MCSGAFQIPVPSDQTVVTWENITGNQLVDIRKIVRVGKSISQRFRFFNLPQSIKIRQESVELLHIVAAQLSIIHGKSMVRNSRSKGEFPRKHFYMQPREIIVKPISNIVVVFGSSQIITTAIIQNLENIRIEILVRIRVA